MCEAVAGAAAVGASVDPGAPRASPTCPAGWLTAPLPDR